MTEWIVPVLTGLFSLAGAFGGVILTQRWADRRDRSQRVAESRDKARAVLAELITDGQEFVDQWTLMVPVVSRMTDQDMTEFVNTDTGREMGLRSRRIRASIANARLLVQDEPLASSLTTFAQCISDHADKAVGPVLMRSRTGMDEMEAIKLGLSHVVATREALKQLEADAAAMLRVPLIDADSDRPGS